MTFFFPDKQNTNQADYYVTGVISVALTNIDTAKTKNTSNIHT